MGITQLHRDDVIESLPGPVLMKKGSEIHNIPSPKSKSSKICFRLSQIINGVKKNTPLCREADFIIRKCSGIRELDDVYRLAHDCYLERKYCDPQPDGRLIQYPHLDNIPETTVLVAYSRPGLIGTVSITVDSKRGFNVEEDFPDEVESARAEGITLASSWRLASRNDNRHEKKVVMKLLEHNFKYIFNVLKADALMSTFNPRHERIYQRLFKFRTIARSNTSVGKLKNAPAVLMRLDRDAIPARWLR